MKAVVTVSTYIIPVVMMLIVIHGMLKNVNVYDEFVNGAKDGMKTVVSIVPTLIGLMMAVGILRASGFLDLISSALGNVTDKIGLPAPLLPLLLVRMFSSSAATGLTLDLFKEYGTDSLIGLIASIATSATETIFFTISVYSVAAKITKTRYSCRNSGERCSCYTYVYQLLKLIFKSTSPEIPSIVPWLVYCHLENS